MSTHLDSRTTSPPPEQGVRLNFGAVFVPVGLLTLGLLMLAMRAMIRRQLAPRRRHLAIFVLVTYMPRLGFYAFLVAGIVSVGADLTVRLFIAPMVYRWLRPPDAADTFATPVEFSLASRESIVEEFPARRRVGSRWEPGRLILTTDRLGFAPRAWDAETTWSPRRELARINLVEPPKLGGRFVRGVPPAIEVLDRTGAEQRYAVDDPQAVLGWFGAARGV